MERSRPAAPPRHAPRRLEVDGTQVDIEAQAHRPLLDVLREAGHTAPKSACGRGECGACTVLVGDRAVMSCVVLSGTVSGPVTTAAGLGEAGRDLREAFADHTAFQCGFCTPGQVMRAEAVLRSSLDHTREELACALAGNICRCTGYRQIVDAVDAVAVSRKRQRDKR